MSATGSKADMKSLEELQQTEAAKRYKKRERERAALAKKLEGSTPLEVDTQARARERRRLIDSRDGLALERIMWKSDLFPIAHLEEGLCVGRSVCRIEIRDGIGRVLGHGTGFLVSPSVLMTNNHVLPDADSARQSLAQFNYENDMNLMPRPTKSFRLDPDQFFVTDQKLDFTLVAVEKASSEDEKLSQFGHLKLLTDSGKALVGEYVSIIQHPLGAPKAVAVRENQIVDNFSDYVHYATDTERGSSGSPVFSDGWDVVALHHAGVPDPNDPGGFVANEGVRISSIAKSLSKLRPQLGSEEQAVLDEVLGQGGGGSSALAQPMNTETHEMEWYVEASGYDEKFLGGNRAVPLPKVPSDLERDVAELKDGGTVLDYNHFSAVMNKSRRLAFFTAVNIDGSRLKSLKRETDRWYYDPRLDKRHQSGPELYKYNDLDRGHLVRRLDPVWGESAFEANEDTFHLTNCAPQHCQLNRKTWLRLEDYVYENAGKHDLKVCVFTGPVFRDDDVLYRGEYRIPVEFWKVVVMVRDAGKLSATAYLQTQKNLIDVLEFAYGEYETYQVPVSTVEQLTQLDFGKLRTHDPIAGIEALGTRVIRGPKDIRL